MNDSVSYLPLVSVVIPAFNEGDHLEECIQSILNQDYPTHRIEILIVDGCSLDHTREIATEFEDAHPNVHVLDNPGRIVSTAMNIGIEHARGEYIVRVDGHCILEPDYVGQCIHYLRTMDADNVGGLMRPIGKGYVGRAIALTMSSPLAVGDAKFRYAREMQQVDTVYLGAFPRDVFDRVGGYNPSLVRNQDYELNYRIRASGGRIYLAPALRSHYVSRRTLWTFGGQYFDYGFWKVQMLKQHPESIRWRQLAAPSLVATLGVTVLGSPFVPKVRRLFAVVLGLYGVLAAVFTFLTARRHGWRYLPILPITFASMHLSWGLGFLWGLVRRPQVTGDAPECGE